MHSLTQPISAIDPRIEAFCAPAHREVFHSVCHAKEVCTPDPFDVRSIHAEAREVFEAMVARATTPPGTSAGRSLLLLGESGSGKTHLMRAFRAYVHARDLGYCGYLQMTTPTRNYGRYILSKLLASLDERYDEPRVQLSGLMRLSTALVDSLGPDYASVIEELRVSHFRGDELAEFVDRLSKDILEGLEPQGHDLLGPIRALVYLQRHDSAVRAAAHSYLRCEDLSPFDRDSLGRIVPRTDDADPPQMIAAIGYLMWAVHGRPLVIFVDQLEEMYNLENAKELFRRAMGALNALAESVPSSIVVIACLEDYYEQLKGSLAQPLIDRLERDPDKLRLESRRSEQEVIDLAAARLAVLYEDAGIQADDNEPTFPIPLAELRERRNTRTRDVLDWCRRYQENFRLTDRPEEADRQVAKEPANDRPVADHDGLQRGVAELEERWQTFLAEGKWPVPVEESELAAVLARALEHCGGELPRGRSVRASADERYVSLELVSGENPNTKVLVAVCNRRPQGGGLAKQVAELEQRAAGEARFIVRSMEFPSNPKTHIAIVLGDYIARGGQRAVIEDSLWRAMLAFDDFHTAHQAKPAFADWLVAEKPLTRLRPLREMLDAVTVQNGTPPLAPPPEPAEKGRAGEARGASPIPAPPLGVAGPIEGVLSLGKTCGLSAAAVGMNCEELTRHAALLGGSGSGKTTIALNIIEQLLERRVPVVLIDRKGDLCGYADRDWWQAHADDDCGTARKRALRDRVDVRLYTPGGTRGRPLRLSLVPPGISNDKEFEELASAAGAALAGMIGFSDPRYAPQRAIVIHAVKQLAQLNPQAESSIRELVDFIDSEDPVLINAIGRLDTKHFKKIVEKLETLRLMRGALFDPAAESLEFDRLLGARAPGRTPLTIISTRFLGDTIEVQFWIAQFLNQLRRWTNAHPSPTLQAVLLFDEADVYLPARSQPPSKAPMEDLLRRARSAGIGILLATQSPGDFDYKCRENIRSWFLGRIKEDTALGKLKPMFENARGNVAEKLAAQQPGEFQFVRDGEVTSLKADRALMQTIQLADERILQLASASAATA